MYGCHNGVSASDARNIKRPRIKYTVTTDKCMAGRGSSRRKGKKVDADVVHQWIVGFRRIADNDNHVHRAAKKEKKKYQERRKRERGSCGRVKGRGRGETMRQKWGLVDHVLSVKLRLQARSFVTCNIGTLNFRIGISINRRKNGS